MTIEPSTRQSGMASGHEPANLGDILERVLDKGLVIVGDIRVSLLDIELLTIKLRLLIASVNTARELGIDWWERDPWLTSGARESLGAGESLHAGESLQGAERDELPVEGEPTRPTLKSGKGAVDSSEFEQASREETRD